MNTKKYFALYCIYSITLCYVISFPTQLYSQAWQNRVHGINEDIRSIDFADSNTAIAVGNEGLILRTTNAGITWKRITAPTAQKLNAVAMHSNGEGYIGGDFATMLKTTDYGQSWQIIDGNISQNDPESFYASMDVSQDSNSIVFCGRSSTELGALVGVIGVSKDKGAHWNITYMDSCYVVQQCRRYANGLLIAVGAGSRNGGIILRSSDDGVTWSIVKKTDFIINAIDGNGIYFYAVGLLKQMLKSTDGGISWQRLINADDAIVYQSVYAKNVNELWICGNRGTVITSNNGGESWKNISMAEDVMLNAVFLSPKDEILVVGEKGVLASHPLLSTSVDGEAITSHNLPNGELYYNPLYHSLEIKVMEGEDQHLYVFDLVGNLIWEQKGIPLLQDTVSLPPFAAGVYSAVLKSNDVRQSTCHLFVVN